jgi:hypothetical protein
LNSNFLSTIENGESKRKEKFIERKCEMFGRLHGDIFHVNKYLLDNIELSVKLTKANDSFCLIGSETGCSLKINDIALYVRKVRINQQVLLAHALNLEKTNALYPLTKVDVVTRVVNSGVISDKFENIVKGQLPKRVVIGMVESEKYNGNSTNPFYFHHFDISELTLSIDGESTHYPLKFDFDNKLYLTGYQTLFSGIDYNGNNISINDYVNGYFLVAVDLSQDGCINDSHFNLERQGNLRLNFKFKNALTKAINVIIYMEFDNILQFNPNKIPIYEIE